MPFLSRELRQPKVLYKLSLFTYLLIFTEHERKRRVEGRVEEGRKRGKDERNINVTETHRFVASGPIRQLKSMLSTGN